MTLTAYSGCDVFDGSARHSGKALLVDGARINGIVADDAIPAGATRVDLAGGIIAPGFVDLQLNGGGGAMLNDAPTVETLKTIATAHLRLGSTSILPTLITDTAAQSAAAIDAAAQAIKAGVASIKGLHLEGPHLSVARKGAHEAGFIRPMSDADLALYCDAAQKLPALLLTVAAETVPPAQIRALSKAGVIVSLGHTDADYATCIAAVEAGARCTTHLFNAMSPLGNREPGCVGATLASGALSCGLIADGIHVHPAAIAAALRAKQGPGQVFLVTDAMAPAGSDQSEFTLNGRRILRRNGRLTLEDGTLAGADLDMAQAVRVLVNEVGVPVDRALAMATAIPAALIDAKAGTLSTGAAADFVHLDSELQLKAVWQSGAAL